MVMPDGLVYGFNKKGLWVLDAATGKPVHGDKARTVTPPGPPQPSYRVWGNRWTAPAIAALEALKEWLAMAEGTDLIVKRDLMKALAALGPKGKPALPAVLGALARPWEACVQEPAAAALKAMVAADHEALSHPDPQVRRMVLPRLEVPGWMRNSALRDAGGAGPRFGPGDAVRNQASSTEHAVRANVRKAPKIVVTVVVVSPSEAAPSAPAPAAQRPERMSPWPRP